jgi:hypothetical protein
MYEFFCVMLYCVGTDLVMGRSPVQRVLPQRISKRYLPPDKEMCPYDPMNHWNILA